MEDTSREESRLEEIGDSGRECLGWILSGMGIESEIEVDVRDGQVFLNVLSGPDSSIAIGRKGQTLEALQILVTRITARSYPEILGGTKILVDVEGYRERRQNNLLETARKAAEEVQQTGESFLLEPLNSYERYLVHNALKEETGIRTSSRGDGTMKQIVIEPVSRGTT